MSIKNNEMIQKLKMMAIRRCEERIEQAARDAGERRDYQPPQFGISTLMKQRHGL